MNGIFWLHWCGAFWALMNQGSLELGGGFTLKGRRYGIGYAASYEALGFCMDPEALGINEVWWLFWLLLGGRIIHV